MDQSFTPVDEPPSPFRRFVSGRSSSASINSNSSSVSYFFGSLRRSIRDKNPFVRSNSRSQTRTEYSLDETSASGSISGSSRNWRNKPRKYLNQTSSVDIQDEEWCWKPASANNQHRVDALATPLCSRRGLNPNRVPDTTRQTQGIPAHDMHHFLYSTSVDVEPNNNKSGRRQRRTKVIKWPPPSPVPVADRDQLDLLDSESHNDNVHTLLSSPVPSRPPSAIDAQRDIYAHVRRLLNPSVRTTQSANNTPTPNRRFYAPPSIARSSKRSSTRGSQQSLMSLMSSIAGTSAFGSPRMSKRNVNVNMRSTASVGGSSRGSHCDYVISHPMSNGSASSRRSYIGSRLIGGRQVVGSGTTISALTSKSSRLQPPDGLRLRPQFAPIDTTCASELDSTFVGREWLFREIGETLLRPDETVTRTLIVQGAGGTGKTSICRQLAAHSPFFGASSTSTSSGGSSDIRSSTDSGCYINGSRVSLEHPITTDYLHSVASRIIGVHFCRVENAPTCKLVEFVCNMAAQLACIPCLRPYADYLVSEPELQQLLTVTECERHDPIVVFDRCIVQPLNKLKLTFDHPLLILVDAVDEAEFHRGETGADSIAVFVRKHADRMPQWCRWIVTLKSEQIGLLEPFPTARRVSLDDAVLDERVYRDAQFYLDARLTYSTALQDQIADVSGVPNGDDPYAHFANHMITTARGNMLYLNLTLNLIEQGHLKLRTASYSALPVNLAEVFLLMFNLKYPSSRAYDRVSPILSVLLATLTPLSVQQLHGVINSGRTGDYMSVQEFEQRLSQLSDFITRSPDNTVTLFHPAFRDWLMRRSESNVPKFFVDIRQGHMLLALSMSRRGGLTSDQLFELGHHLLKAHPYKHLKMAPDENPDSARTSTEAASGRDCQLMWIQQSAADLTTALCSDRNMIAPNTKVTRLLLMAGASADACLPTGQPLLCQVAAIGQTDLCSLLLEFGAKVDITDNTNDSMTPLMIAARHGHLDVLQILHQHGAKLNAVDSKDRNVLVHAAECGHVTVVSFLLQCDWSSLAFIDSAIPSTSMTPSLSNGVDCALTNQRQAATQQAFVAAAAANQMKVCQFLYDMCDVSVDCVCPVTKQTALNQAAARGHGELVRYLLQCGACIRSTNGAASTPLLSAVAGGSWEIVSLLLARGLDVEHEHDSNGYTPLMAASQHGHIGVMELLLSRGADVSTTTHAEGHCALHCACVHNQHACAALLIDRGSHLINARDRNQRTPLHLAAKHGGKRLVQLLLDRGANMELVDAQNRRPIDQSIAEQNMSTLACFLRRGAKLSTLTWELARGQPAVGIALLQKLVEDGALLYRRNRLKDASHRFEYAQRKLAHIQLEGVEPEMRDRLRAVTYNIIIGLGRCKRRNGQYTEAIECCDDALRLSVPTGGFEAYLLRAKCHFDNQDMCKAQADAREAVRLNASNDDARQLLASLQLPATTSIGSKSEPRVPMADCNNKQPPTTTTPPREQVPLHLDSNNHHPKRASPADCSSDSGNQADFDDPHTLSPSRRSCETEL